MKGKKTSSNQQKRPYPKKPESIHILPDTVVVPTTEKLLERDAVLNPNTVHRPFLHSIFF